MRLGQTLVVILLTPFCVVFGAINELGDSFRCIREIWSEEL